MKLRLQLIPGLFFVFTLALTASCGGGGGSAGFTASPLAITTGNAPQVSAQTINVSGVLSTAGDQADGTVTASSVEQRVQGLNLADIVMGQLDHLARENGVRRIRSLRVDQAASSESDCAHSGTFSIKSISDNSFSITYNNCVETLGETTNGKVTYSDLDGTDPTQAIWDVSGRVGFVNFRLDSDHVYLVNGAGDFSMGSPDGILDNLSISNASFSVLVDSSTNTLNGFAVDLSENTANLNYTASMSGTLASSLLDGSVTFQTLTQFAGVDLDNNDPESGSMKITGANNSSVTLTAIGAGQVRLEVDADGVGGVDAGGTSTTSWDELGASF